MSVLSEFLAEEASGSVVRILRDELASRTSGSRYFTFNRFNVNLDVDAGTATIEDELDVNRKSSLPLAEFAALLPPLS